MGYPLAYDWSEQANTPRPASDAEIFATSLNAGMIGYNVGGGHYLALSQAWDETLDEYYAKTGERLLNPVTAFQLKADGEKVSPFEPRGDAAYEDQLKIVADKIQARAKGSQDPVLLRLAATATFDGIEKRANDVIKQSVERSREASGTRDFWSALPANLAGGLLGSLFDPAQVAALPIGGGGKTIIGTAVREAAVNAGVQAALEPFVVQQLKDAGIDMTSSEIATDILSAGALGSAFGGGTKGADRLIGLMSGDIIPVRKLGFTHEAEKALEKEGLAEGGYMSQRQFLAYISGAGGKKLGDAIFGRAGVAAAPPAPAEPPPPATENGASYLELSPTGVDPNAYWEARKTMSRADALKTLGASVPPVAETATDVASLVRKAEHLDQMDEATAATTPEGLDISEAMAGVYEADDVIRALSDEPAQPPERIAQASEENARAAAISGDESPSPAHGAVDHVNGKPRTFMQFDPRALEAEPQVFQYKNYDGEGGTTGRLAGVEKWDNASSGKTFVYEYDDGRQVVADGHQRRNLAIDLMNNGEPPILQDGFLYRQKDGWTPGEVRLEAAKKNLREQPGDPIDIATVLRESPNGLDSTVPQRGPAMRIAKGLARLDDDAFGAVRAGQLSPALGAIIGHIAADQPEVHMPIVNDFMRNPPRTQREAEYYVHEALSAGLHAQASAQLGLFGQELVSGMQIRGEIVSKALTLAEGDARAFGAAERNADALEQAGNVLARDENQRRRDLATALRREILNLATRPGPVSDLLRQVAADAAENNSSTTMAAREFLEGTVSLLEERGLMGLKTSTPGAPPPATERPVGIVEPHLENEKDARRLDISYAQDLDDGTHRASLAERAVLKAFRGDSDIPQAVIDRVGAAPEQDLQDVVEAAAALHDLKRIDDSFYEDPTLMDAAAALLADPTPDMIEEANIKTGRITDDHAARLQAGLEGAMPARAAKSTINELNDSIETLEKKLERTPEDNEDARAEIETEIADLEDALKTAKGQGDPKNFTEAVEQEKPVEAPLTPFEYEDEAALLNDLEEATVPELKAIVQEYGIAPDRTLKGAAQHVAAIMDAWKQQQAPAEPKPPAEPTREEVADLVKRGTRFANRDDAGMRYQDAIADMVDAVSRMKNGDKWLEREIEDAASDRRKQFLRDVREATKRPLLSEEKPKPGDAARSNFDYPDPDELGQALDAFGERWTKFSDAFDALARESNNLTSGVTEPIEKIREIMAGFDDVAIIGPAIAEHAPEMRAILQEAYDLDPEWWDHAFLQENPAKSLDDALAEKGQAASNVLQDSGDGSFNLEDLMNAIQYIAFDDREFFDDPVFEGDAKGQTNGPEIPDDLQQRAMELLDKLPLPEDAATKPHDPHELFDAVVPQLAKLRRNLDELWDEWQGEIGPQADQAGSDALQNADLTLADAIAAFDGAADVDRGLRQWSRPRGVRLAEGTGLAPYSTIEQIDRATQRAFGKHTRDMLRMGQVEVVRNVDETPAPDFIKDEYRGKRIQGWAVGDGQRALGKAYLFADSLRPEDVRGAVLHEIGMHIGMEGFLGHKGFLDLKDQMARMIANDDPAMLAALERVPDDTPHEYVLEEAGAYAVQYHPDSHIGRTIIAAARAWLWKTFPGLRRTIGLDVAAIQQLAIGALRQHAAFGAEWRVINAMPERGGDMIQMRSVLNEDTGDTMSGRPDDITAAGDRLGEIYDMIKDCSP